MDQHSPKSIIVEFINLFKKYLLIPTLLLLFVSSKPVQNKTFHLLCARKFIPFEFIFRFLPVLIQESDIFINEYGNTFKI